MSYNYTCLLRTILTSESLSALPCWLASLRRRDGGGRRVQLEGAALARGVDRCRRDASNGDSREVGVLGTGPREGGREFGREEDLQTDVPLESWLDERE